MLSVLLVSSIAIPILGYAKPALAQSMTSINVGSGPNGIAFSPSNNDVYVANSGSNTVSVISSSTNNVVATVNVGSDPDDVAYDPANQDIYVSNDGSNSISVIGTSDNTVIATIPMNTCSCRFAYDPVNQDMYVANAGNSPGPSNTVFVINSANTVLTTITVDPNPIRLAFDPANNDIFVDNYASGEVTIIDGSSNTVIKKISTGANPNSVGYDPANGYMYVTMNNSNQVAVIDGTNSVITTLTVGGNPFGVFYNPANHDVFVSNTISNTVSAINPANTITTINVGTAPYQLTFSPSDNNMYLVNYGGFSDGGTSTVSVISNVNTVTDTLTLGTYMGSANSDASNDSVFDPANNGIYISNVGSGTVYVISSSGSSGSSTPNLSDIFTSNSSLNTNLWQVNGPVGDYVFTHIGSPPASIITPTITFQNGLDMSGVSGTYQAASIQSVQSFSAPFTITTTVDGTIANGNPFVLGISNQAGTETGYIAGNLNSGNGGYYGIWYGSGTSLGTTKIVSNPSTNIPYTLTISVDSSGSGTFIVSSNGNQLGQVTENVGTGSFYILLGQFEGLPYTVGPNNAVWQSVSLTSGSGGTSGGSTGNDSSGGTSSGPTNSGPSNCSTTNPPSVDTSNIAGAESLTLNSGSCEYFFVGSTAGGDPMNGISWIPDLSVTAAYSGNLAISIGHQTSNTGSFSSQAGNHGIAGVGVSGFGSYTTYTASTPSSDNLSTTFTISSNDLVLILVGGEGDGNLALSGITAQTLQDATYSEAGSNVIASEAIYEAHLAPGTYNINISSNTYPTNSGTSLGVAVYDFHTSVVTLPPPGETGSTPVSLSLTGQISGPITNLQMNITSGTVTAGGTSYSVTDTSQYSSGVDVVDNSPNGVLSAGFIHLNNGLNLGLASCYTQTNTNVLSLNFYNGKPPTCGGTTAITQPPSGSFYCPFNATGTLTVSGSQATITASGTGNCNISTATPDFKLAVTPTTQNVAISSSTVFNVQIIPLNSFNSPVTLSLSMPGNEVCSFTPDIDSATQTCHTLLEPTLYFTSVYVYAQSNPESSADVSYPQSGSLSVNLKAEAGSTVKSQKLNLNLVKMIGIQNDVEISKFSVSSSTPCPRDATVFTIFGTWELLDSSCFSIQQNFYLNTLGEMGSHDSPSGYWIQSTELVEKDPSGNIYANAGYNLWNGDASKLLSCSPGKVISNSCYLNGLFLFNPLPSLPDTINFTSTIQGNNLILYNNGVEILSYPIPSGSYIYVGPETESANPQLDIVGGPSQDISNPTEATFSSNSSGGVLSEIELEGTSWSNPILQTPVNHPYSSTGETSKNLIFDSQLSTYETAFTYQQSADDVGVNFRDSSYQTQSIMEEGSSFLSEPSVGVTTLINDPSAKDGYPISMIATQLLGQPIGTPTIKINALDFVDVQVSGISQGIATVCIATPAAFGNTMEYFDGTSWVDATNIQNQFSTICGNIPVSSLQGTPIVIGSDPLKPTISINYPPTNSLVNRSKINGQGTTQDTVGIQKVMVSIDGNQSSPATLNFGDYSNSTVNWAYTTPPLLDGSHVIIVNSTANNGLSSLASVMVTVDTVPPEAYMQFDPTTKNTILYGTDSLSGIPSNPIAPISVVPTKMGDDDKNQTMISNNIGKDDGKMQDQDNAMDNNNSEHGKGYNEIRTYDIVDRADNTLKLIEKAMSHGNEIKVHIVSLQYNNGSIVSAGKNEEKFEWSTDKNGNIKGLEQHVILGQGKNRQDVDAKYSLKDNKTVVDVKNQSGHKTRINEPGLVLLHVATNHGTILVNGY